MGYEERGHWCRREDKNIYGKLFLPGGVGRWPPTRHRGLLAWAEHEPW